MKKSQKQTLIRTLEERDAEPSIVTPIDKEPSRSFILNAPYPERLKAPKKNALDRIECAIDRNNIMPFPID
jgi:hypothetical protein